VIKRLGCCHLFDHQLLSGFPIFHAAVVPVNRVAYKKADEKADRAFGLYEFLGEKVEWNFFLI
jgi:hypothetical protein